MRIPKLPVTSTNEELHRSLKDTISFIGKMFKGGTKCRAISDDEMTSITDIKQVGTDVYNTTDHFKYYSYLDNGALKWRKLQ